jgi:hypothetical protein
VEFAGGEAKCTGGSVHELTATSNAIEREFYDFYRTPRGEFTPKARRRCLRRIRASPATSSS